MTRKKTPEQLKRNKKGCPPHKTVVYDWNRKGQEYKECQECSAFLGFTGKIKK